MKSVFLDKLSVHKDWDSFLTDSIRDLIVRIESEIAVREFTPPAGKVLRFLELPLHSVKVIILGQDPYPQQEAATGRAFEVGTLRSWNESFRNISLKNIVRALYKSYTGTVLNYNEIKEKLDNEFPLLPPGKLFAHWEKQGVLLLNTSFTCIPGNPASHKKIWEGFTFQLLRFISNYQPSVTWFLWGNHAQEATGKLEIKNAVRTWHPMMCFGGPGRENDFLYGTENCFSRFQKEIDWTGFGLKAGFKTSGTLF